MPVPFQELAGSPAERYATDGFSAQREFLVSWEDRDAFAVEVLGEVAAHGGREWLVYPGKPSVAAVDVRFVPFQPDDLAAGVLADLTERVNAYGGSFAKATVLYRTLGEGDRDDDPGTPRGTHLSYRMEYTVESIALPRAGWRWADDPASSLAADYPLTRVVAITDHLLTWHQVVDPPWGTMHQLQGTINEEAFLGCPAGTVLFVGAESNKLYRTGYQAGASDFSWRIRYLFRERSIKHGGGVYGYNHFYRGDPPGWVELTNGTDAVYDTADLSLLFLNATP